MSSIITPIPTWAKIAAALLPIIVSPVFAALGDAGKAGYFFGVLFGAVFGIAMALPTKLRAPKGD